MAQNASMEEFEALLNESFEMDTPEEGSVVKGKVIAIEAGQAIIDVGYKMEGRVELKEFADPGESPKIAVGDEVEVFLRQVESSRGEAVISREMARREEAWDRLEKAYASEERVEGAIFGRVKGGFTVDLGGAVAFLAGSLTLICNILSLIMMMTMITKTRKRRTTTMKTKTRRNENTRKHENEVRMTFMKMYT